MIRIAQVLALLSMVLIIAPASAGPIGNPYLGWTNVDSGKVELDTTAGWWAVVDPNYAEITNLPPGDYYIEIQGFWVWTADAGHNVRFAYLIVDWPTVGPNGEYIGGGISDSTGWMAPPSPKTGTAFSIIVPYLHLEGQAFKVWLFVDGSQNGGTIVRTFSRTIIVKAYPIQ